MRNPERIDALLHLVDRLWRQDTDWRLGQLLMNVTRNEDGSVLDANEVWNLEDDRLIEALKSRLDK